MRSHKTAFNKSLIVASVSATLLAVLLNSCSPRSEVTYDTTNCIQDFQQFTFVIPEPNSERLADKLPPPPWEIEAHITRAGNNYLDVQATRIFNNGSQIWIKDTFEYIVYSTSSKTSFVVDAEIGNSGVFVSGIFVTTNNNEVWGKNYWWNISKVSVESVPALSKYNDITKEFEFVDEALALPVADRITSGGSHVYIPDRDIVALSSTSIFWIYNQKGTLYSFDPSTNHLQKEVEFPNGFRARKIQFLPNGSVVVQREFFALEMQDDDLLVYDIKSESLSNFSVPEGWPNYDMFISADGQLWIGAIGSRSISGEWTTLHPDLDDIFEKFMNYNLSWSAPTIISESIDGRLWVKNIDPYDGLAWYNPKTNTGCQFTTYEGNLVEDKNYTLWLVVEDTLYKLGIEN